MRLQSLYRQFLHFRGSYHPIVHSLLLGTILARMASSMSLPFLAIHLTRTTDLSAVMIGFIIGAGSLAGTFGGFVGGTLSDLFGRRKIMLGALLGWGVVFAGFATAQNVLLFFLLSLLNGLCRSFYEPVSQALMADLTGKEKRMRVFSLRYLAINIGVTVGPLLGALFAAVNSSLAFSITSGTYFAYAFSLYLLLNKFGIRQIEVEKKKDQTFLKVWNVVRSDLVLRYYLLGGIVTAISYSQMTATLSQYVGGKFEDGVTLFAVMTSVNAIIVVVLQVPFSRWAEKRTPLTAIAVGTLMYALGNVGFGLSENWLFFLLSMAVFTFGEILTFPAGALLTDKIAPEKMRGAYYGAQSFSSLGHFIGPWVGGLLLSRYNGTVMFVSMAFVALSSVLFYRMGESVLARRNRMGTAPRELGRKAKA
ncbi:MFS transporter [Cohnella sp. AR92]|uniref:MDR family MFS transporter n=1 Tax=Cohnella sp. AR92 TaxID=648716 RepID=UPI000F8CDF0B|nr:MFS transporter [Cohnella sp. AR92]RUS47761.1 MFS transporter [Cohnella sp. AR92]